MHGYEEEVDLFVVAADEVDLIHRSDDERSTSSSWPRRRPFLGIDESHPTLVVGALGEVDLVLVAVDEIDLVCGNKQQ